jgi:MFS family permease
MQTVGAQWLLVHQPHASILVPLVQTAEMLPVVMFALAGGVLADVFDRRWLLIIVDSTLAVVGAALAILTFANEMPPALLLSFTFVLGAGTAFSVPAYQALIPDLVPRSQVSSAASLSSVSINLARAVGPAIAGVLIARTGVGAVFALNAATFLFFALVVIFRRFPERSAPQLPERFGSAMLVGVRYVRHAPVVRRILLRAALFLIPASALWALLPLVATQIFAQGADGYGLSLGALGFGAVAGAFLLPQLRARMSSNRLMVTASLVYATAVVVLVLVHSFAVGLIVLVPAGCRVDCGPVEHQRHAAVVSTGLGSGTRTRDVSDCAFRHTGSGRCSLGRRGGTRRTYSHVPHRGGRNRRRRCNDCHLAIYRH